MSTDDQQPEGPGPTGPDRSGIDVPAAALGTREQGRVSAYLGGLEFSPGDAVDVHSQLAPSDLAVSLVKMAGAAWGDQTAAICDLDDVPTEAATHQDSGESRRGSGAVFEITGATPGPDDTVAMWIYAAHFDPDGSTLLSWGDHSWSVSITLDADGLVTVRTADGTTRAPRALVRRAWQLIVISPSGELSITTARSRYANEVADQFLEPDMEPVVGGAAWADAPSGTMAGRTVLGGGLTTSERSFTGKFGPCGWFRDVDTATLVAELRTDPAGLDLQSEVVAWWTPADYDPATGSMPARHGDRSAAAHNTPIGACTGPNWTGRFNVPRCAIEEYSAVRLAADAVTDCGWPKVATFRIPAGTASGVYGASVVGPDGARILPFIVRPAAPTAQVVVVLPTMSYVAEGGAIAPHPMLASPISFGSHGPGRSTTDVYLDGSGVMVTGVRRPIPELTPDGIEHDRPRPSRFAQDLQLLGFLDKVGIRYDVIGDETVDREGSSVLSGYRVAITGSNPAYASRSMIEAWSAYAAGGGRIMYLGGGGWYWVAAYGPGGTIEVRRGEAGTRTWECLPGETSHAFGGERGGLWRAKGMAPQKVFGVGFTAVGKTPGSAYRRLPDSYHKAVDWVFEGVPETFGTDLANTPAADEIDRYDRSLGTPPHCRVLASSNVLPNDYVSAIEDVMFNHPGLTGEEDYKVRADMTLMTTANDGAVFSVGSANWTNAIAANGFDNSVALLTANVLRAFTASGSLRGTRFDDEDDLVRG